MKYFLINVLKFLILPLVLILILVYLDPFKVFKSYESYYKENFIELNRETVCYRTYMKHRKDQGFNSFIFGNSRSRVFRCKEWVKYLDENAIPFHFDGAGEGVYGVLNKVKKIDEQGDSIKNALIIVDRTFLTVTSNREGHLFISPPGLSNDSAIHFYSTFLKASLNFNFLKAYIYFSIYQEYKDFMGNLIRESKYSDVGNDINCDFWYGYDENIKLDSLGYYNELIKKGVFTRALPDKRWVSEVTELEIEQLTSIKSIFKRHNTKYNIIVSPTYDQIPLEEDQVQLLVEIFGNENVYNFSGKNSFTESISNYYEDSHYRPVVANEILKIIYGKKSGE